LHYLHKTEENLHFYEGFLYKSEDFLSGRATKKPASATLRVLPASLATPLFIVHK